MAPCSASALPCSVPCDMSPLLVRMDVTGQWHEVCQQGNAHLCERDTCHGKADMWCGCRVRQVLGEALTAEDDAAVLQELEELEGREAQAEASELPAVPKVTLAAHTLHPCIHCSCLQSGCRMLRCALLSLQARLMQLCLLTKLLQQLETVQSAPSLSVICSLHLAHVCLGEAVIMQMGPTCHFGGCCVAHELSWRRSVHCSRPMRRQSLQGQMEGICRL